MATRLVLLFTYAETTPGACEIQATFYILRRNGLLEFLMREIAHFGWAYSYRQVLFLHPGCRFVLYPVSL
jgi:hypothetical protein